MKKLLLLLLVTGIVFAGCMKKDELPSSKGQFSINGTSYTLNTIHWLFDGELYNILSADTTGIRFGAYVVNKAPGESNFDGSNEVYLVVGNVTYNSIDGGGKITISRSDNYLIEGTFDGRFSIRGSNSEVNATGSFTATIAPQ